MSADSNGSRAKARKAKSRSEAGRRPYLAAAERRKRIIAAAQEVFAQTSLQGARTRDLAKAAATSQATLFEHFESKEALFQAAVVEPLLEAMRGMSDRAKGYEFANSFEQLDRLGRASAEVNAELMAKIFPFFTAALFSDLAFGKQLYRERIEPLLGDRARAMSSLVKDSLDPNFVELAVFGVYFALAMDRAFVGKRWDTPALIDQIAVFFTSGFLKDPHTAGTRVKGGARRGRDRNGK
ncbi:MAG TPA: helix-turn-helix domain-containing protein [Steroidobacteraceae bacterium]|jgi:AcrR family transcriptional regulator|nr:helix-turn-helix domain-containing protein [Steroidobacteraceae bacterium]